MLIFFCLGNRTIPNMQHVCDDFWLVSLPWRETCVGSWSPTAWLLSLVLALCFPSRIILSGFAALLRSRSWTIDRNLQGTELVGYLSGRVSAHGHQFVLMPPHRRKLDAVLSSEAADPLHRYPIVVRLSETARRDYRIPILLCLALRKISGLSPGFQGMGSSKIRFLWISPTASVSKMGGLICVFPSLRLFLLRR